MHIQASEESLNAYSGFKKAWQGDIPIKPIHPGLIGSISKSLPKWSSDSIRCDCPISELTYTHKTIL